MQQRKSHVPDSDQCANQQNFAYSPQPKAMASETAAAEVATIAKTPCAPVRTSGQVTTAAAEPPAKRARGLVKVVQDQPLVLEVEEAAEPENQGRSTAEPAKDTVQWMISEDHEQKWWRACNPDFAAALEVQRCKSERTATLHFYPRPFGQIYRSYRRTYVHDLESMVQVDTNRHLTWPLRCTLVLLSSSSRPAPVPTPAPLEG